ncbi:anti-sigma factor [Metabacillus dongyingensis]|uniref:anti-sigma factor domain-containing protein n=1 Tax=Metabacillus dongyingensis TaxID=2874282 RepID=UPI003B8BF5F3
MVRECENLLSFIADELDAKEKRKFEEHLQHCLECSREYKQMTEAWNSLHWDFEEKEVPASLKADVMDFVFESEKKNVNKSIRAKLEEWGSFLQRQFTPITAVIVLVFMCLSIGQSISNVKLRNELVSEENLKSAPIEVLSTLSLQSANQANSNVRGHASILQQGEDKRLVVQVNNLPRLEGSEVYQVWLLKNGNRENAGIFKPDESGAGVLTYQLAQNSDFDQIGITVEPDQYSTQPRGKKIVGSS